MGAPGHELGDGVFLVVGLGVVGLVLWLSAQLPQKRDSTGLPPLDGGLIRRGREDGPVQRVAMIFLGGALTVGMFVALIWAMEVL